MDGVNALEITVSRVPLRYASTTSRPRTRMATPPRRILIKGEADFLAEGDIRRFLKLGLGICKTAQSGMIRKTDDCVSL